MKSYELWLTRNGTFDTQNYHLFRGQPFKDDMGTWNTNPHDTKSNYITYFCIFSFHRVVNFTRLRKGAKTRIKGIKFIPFYERQKWNLRNS